MIHALTNYLDNSCELKPNIIKLKKWKCIPVPDVMNPMEAEWLSNTIKNKLFLHCVESISFEFQFKNIIKKTIDISRDSIIKENFNNSHNYFILVGKSDEFIYYKDQGNRYFLLCGDDDFIKESYKASFDTAKIMFFNWINDLDNDKEKKFLKAIWQKYSLS